MVTNDDGYPHGEQLAVPSLINNYLSFSFCALKLRSLHPHNHDLFPTPFLLYYSSVSAKPNMTHVDPNKNSQKRSKANANIHERHNVYWDNQGKFQEQYNQLLDALPHYGKGSTKASEIFRAATKLYYDFYNNGMVNNTSGAANYLLFTGVFTSANDYDYALINPYTTGARILVKEEVDVRLAMERMMDRTITFIFANAELSGLKNDINYLEFTQQCEINHLNRCLIRNFNARKMKDEEEEATPTPAPAPAVLVGDEDEKGRGGGVTNLTKAQDCTKEKKKKKKDKDKKGKRRVPTAKNLANIVNNGISSIAAISKK